MWGRYCWHYIVSLLNDFYFSSHWQYRNDPVRAQEVAESLSTPIENVVDIMATSTFSHNVDDIGAAIDALRKAGNEIGQGLHRLKEGYVALEIKAAKLRHSNYVLRRRALVSAGE